ncbi:MAG: ABC transporter ATP-binding protein [Hyphomicrobium sp.]|jgi:lipopolysaccharide transport system ATP-binding protein
MSSDAVIEVEGLGKSYYIYGRPEDRLKQMIVPKLERLVGRPARQYYREFWALRDISFHVGRGETVGVIGSNGSGKSTLLQLIVGTLSPTTGSVWTQGRIAALLELGAGFNPEFTGRENAILNAAILGYSQDDQDEWMEKIVAFSELKDFIDQPIKTYSSGMYARLAFSISINVEPDILIVDEALAVGDSRFVAKCMRRIKSLQDRGVSILFVSHDVTSVRTLCQRAVWLKDGKLLEDGDAFSVTGRYVEYLFKDDIGEKQAKLRQQDDAAEASGDVAAAPAEKNEHTAAAVPAPDDVAIKLDKRPVTHWGSHKGLILSAAVRDEQGNRRDVIPWGEPIRISIDVRIPSFIPRNHLSVAFSIKDLRGNDLIVSTTHDVERRRLPEEERFNVTFRFVNPLVTGDYLLVAAVEDRQSRDIHYYEYFEGAHYFSSMAMQRFFGTFQPPVLQIIAVEQIAGVT